MDHFEATTCFSDGSPYPTNVMFPDTNSIKQEPYQDPPSDFQPTSFHETACLYATNSESEALDPLNITDTSPCVVSNTDRWQQNSSSSPQPYIVNAVSLAGRENQWSPSRQARPETFQDSSGINYTHLNGGPRIDTDNVWMPTATNDDPLDTISFSETYVESIDTMCSKIKNKRVPESMTDTELDPLDIAYFDPCVEERLASVRPRRRWVSGMQSNTPPPGTSNIPCLNNVIRVTSIETRDPNITLSPEKSVRPPPPLLVASNVPFEESALYVSSLENIALSPTKPSISNNADEYDPEVNVRKCESNQSNYSDFLDQSEHSSSSDDSYRSDRRTNPTIPSTKKFSRKDKSALGAGTDQNIFLDDFYIDAYQLKKCYIVVKKIPIEITKISEANSNSKSIKLNAICNENIVKECVKGKRAGPLSYKLGKATNGSYHSFVQQIWSMTMDVAEETDNSFKCQLCSNASRHVCYQNILIKNFHVVCKSFKCCNCSQLMHSPSSLKSHMIYLHQKCIYRCIICMKKFGSRSSLHAHEPCPSLHESKPCPPTVKLECPLCKALLSNSGGLKRHMKNVHGEKEFKSPKPSTSNVNSKERHICFICGREVSSHPNLLRHIKLHKKSNPKDMPRTDLQVKTVNNDKFETCDICQKSFRNSAALHEHQLTHSLLKHQCVICKTRFVTYSGFTKHMKNIHKKKIGPKSEKDKKGNADSANDTEINPDFEKETKKSDKKIEDNVENINSKIAFNDRKITSTIVINDRKSTSKIELNQKKSNSKIIHNDRKSTSKIELNEKMSNSKIVHNDRKSTSKIELNDKKSTSTIVINDKSTSKIELNEKKSNSKIVHNDRKSTSKIELNDKKSTSKIVLNDRKSTSKIELNEKKSNSKIEFNYKKSNSKVGSSANPIPSSLVKTKSGSLVGQLCVDCGVVMKNAAYVAAHKQLHSIQKVRHECTICQECFPTMQNLLEHQLAESHIGYQCDICKKVLGVRKHLVRHIKAHSTSKNYCGICQMLFASKYQLIDHNKMIHTRGFKCDLCSLVSGSRQSLVEHVQHTHF